MQKCLAIPEIVHTIFQSFAPVDNIYGIYIPVIDVDDDLERRRTLAILARVCKGFQRHSSSILWRVLGSFIPLLRTIPSDALEYNEGEMTWHLKRGIVPGDLVVFKQYAGLVRQLGAYPLAGEQGDILNSVSTGVLQALALCFPNRPLLPNLTHLSWSGSSECFRLIQHFLTPTLDSLCMSYKTDMYNAAIFAMIPICSPNLRHLTLVTLEDDDETASLLLGGIPGLEGVRLVILQTSQAGGHAGFSELSTLPRLKRIMIEPSTQHILRLFTVDTFQAIQELFIVEICIHCVALLGKSLAAWGAGPARLTTLVLQDLRATADDFQDLVMVIGTCPAFQNLSILAINENNPDRAAQQKVSLEPLAKLRRLEDLHVHSDQLILDDRTLLWMAAAWPDMQALTLSPYNIYHPPPATGPTLEGLAHLILNCTKLESLEIIVDGTLTPPLDAARPLQGRTSKALGRLRVLQSDIRDAVAVAAFLSSVAPAFALCVYMEDVRAKWISNGDGNAEERATFHQRYRSWCDVQRLLPAFAAVRQQERGA